MQHLTFENIAQPKEEPSLENILYVKASILTQAILTATFILGMSSNLARSLQKLFHRLMYDNDKFYKCSFWLSLVGNYLFCYIFVNYWQCGSITDFKLIKSSLITTNIIGFIVIKVLLIESQ